MTRIALATSSDLPELDPDSQLLLPAFEQLGVDAEPTVWSDPAVDWAAFDAVVIRSTWDYFDREDEFLAWVKTTGAIARRFINPPDLVEWNAHKTYLRELADKGVPVVDTQWIESGQTASVEHAHGIVKPAVSGGAQGLGARCRRSVAEAHDGVGHTALADQPGEARAELARLLRAAARPSRQGHQARQKGYNYQPASVTSVHSRRAPRACASDQVDPDHPLRFAPGVGRSCPAVARYGRRDGCR